MNEEDLFRYTSGPKTSKVMLVGEAWGQSEAAAQRPFCGSSGHELDRILFEAGLPRDQVLCANLVNSQPPQNKFSFFLVDNATGKKEKREKLNGIYPGPLLLASRNRLHQLVARVNPELVIVAGNWPLWALSSHTGAATTEGYSYPTGITTWRGSQTWTLPINDLTYPLLPIVHPAAIQRDWSWRAPTVHDLRARAVRFLNKHLPWEAKPLTGQWRPTFASCEAMLHTWMARACHRELWLSVDIETYLRKWISCIGFADDQTELCIPWFFIDAGAVKPYFTLEQEQYLWLRLKQLLEHPNVKIIGQNFIYDSQFLARSYNINAIASFDTLVGHHLLFPGTPKTLHYLASLYCDSYCYWKDESEDWQADEVSAEDLWKYNCKDTRATYEIAQVLKTQISKADGFCCEDARAAEINTPLSAGGMWEQMTQRIQAWKLARKMSIKGILYDNTVRREFQIETYNQASTLEQFLLNAMPEMFRYSTTRTPWFSSAPWAINVIYARLGVSPVKHKKTKRPTLDDTAINELCERKDCEWLWPIFHRLRALRSAGVFRSHFLDVKLGPTGRLHTEFVIAHPETFRWSSRKNPFGEGGNLQNVPKVED